MKENQTSKKFRLFGGREERGEDILGDLPRGQEGRAHKDNHPSHSYFEDPGVLARIGFRDHAGDDFLGVVGGRTQAFRRDDGRIEHRTLGGVPVGSRDDRHRFIAAGSRAGKGRSALIPQLLTSAGSFIVNDCKGELAAITARYRAEILGHRVFILDPFGITPPHCEFYRARFNPLGSLGINNPTIIEDLALMADALIVPQGSKDSHWDETAKAFIEGVCLHVATGEFIEEERNLATVAELITGKQGTLRWLLDQMIENGGPGDRVAAAATTLMDMGDNERGSVVSNARKNLKFLDFDAMSSSLSGNDFDLADLKNRPMTVYLVLPATRMNTCRQWLRLFVNLTLAAIERNPAKPAFPVQMLLDEMPTLGYMKELENAIGQMAGLGLRITSVVQDLGQLKALYNDRFETFLGNSGLLEFFGVSDYFTSDWISKYLGETTLRVSEHGSTSLDSKNRGHSGTNFRQQRHRLLTPEEIRRYFAREDHKGRKLVCMPGRKPAVIQRINYDQHELFAGRFDKWW